MPVGAMRAACGATSPMRRGPGREVGGADAARDQARAPIDGSVPQRTSGVVIGMFGPDQQPSEPVDLHAGRLAARALDFHGDRCVHGVLLALDDPSEHAGAQA